MRLICAMHSHEHELRHSLKVGDKIPADCRLLEVQSASFRVDQSILTGESVSVSKDTSAIADARAVKQDMTNIIFSVGLLCAGC